MHCRECIDRQLPGYRHPTVESVGKAYLSSYLFLNCYRGVLGRVLSSLPDAAAAPSILGTRQRFLLCTSECSCESLVRKEAVHKQDTSSCAPLILFPSHQHSPLTVFRFRTPLPSQPHHSQLLHNPVPLASHPLALFDFDAGLDRFSGQSWRT